MAIVSPVERPAGEHNVGAAQPCFRRQPPVVRYLLGLPSLGWPLVAAGAVKIAYDLLLLTMLKGAPAGGTSAGCAIVAATDAK
jgi:hypothetical protein